MERDKSEEVTVPNREDSGNRQDSLFLSNLHSTCFGGVGWQEGVRVPSHGISHSGSWSRGVFFVCLFVFNQKDPSPLLLHLNSVFLFPWKPGRPDCVRGRPVSEESKDLGAAVAAPCSAFPSVWPEDLESDSSAETSCGS